MELIGKFSMKFKSWLYVAFRVIFGVLFALHGAQKLGLMGREAMAGFMLFIGVCEVLIGAGIAVGAFTRLASIGGFVIMVGALTTAHFPKGLVPLGNGESAWLYLGAFLILFAMGSGKLSLEKAVLKKEIF